MFTIDPVTDITLSIVPGKYCPFWDIFTFVFVSPIISWILTPFFPMMTPIYIVMCILKGRKRGEWKRDLIPQALGREI